MPFLHLEASPCRQVVKVKGSARYALNPTTLATTDTSNLLPTSHFSHFATTSFTPSATAPSPPPIPKMYI